MTFIPSGSTPRVTDSKATQRLADDVTIWWIVFNCSDNFEFIECWAAAESVLVLLIERTNGRDSSIVWQRAIVKFIALETRWKFTMMLLPGGWIYGAMVQRTFPCTRSTIGSVLNRVYNCGSSCMSAYWCASPFAACIISMFRDR